MKKLQGLTLPELLVGISVVGILSSLSIPTFSDFIRKNELNENVNSVIALVRHARQRAITDQQTIVLCPSQNGRHCDQSSWTKHLILFTDFNNNKKRDDDEPLHYTPTLKTKASIYWKASGRAPYLRFNQYGHGITFGSFYFCSYPDRKHVKRLAVSRIGRTVIHPDSNKDNRPDSVKDVSKVCS